MFTYLDSISLTLIQTLRSRIISHQDIQEHLTGRYYLSPSRLYSAIRLLPNKQGYDVPVAGDWITIAVVAERGPIKFSRAPVGIGKDEGNGLPDDDERNAPSNESAKPKGRRREEPPKSSGKKYVNIKLIDFGARSRSSSSATGGKATIRGDAFLTLLLFESDGYDLVDDDNGKRKKVYKGGSRGAFEAMSKLKEGDVIALLNSKILKPFQVCLSTVYQIFIFMYLIMIHSVLQTLHIRRPTSLRSHLNLPHQSP
jgi:minichromosome maintenance protein 10